MNALLSIVHPRRFRWEDYRPLSAVERMARYNTRRAADMQQRENEGAGLPRVCFPKGRLVLVALGCTANPLPKDHA
jgi:hypothetical protein